MKLRKTSDIILRSADEAKLLESAGCTGTPLPAQRNLSLCRGKPFAQPHRPGIRGSRAGRAFHASSVSLPVYILLSKLEDVHSPNAMNYGSLSIDASLADVVRNNANEPTRRGVSLVPKAVCPADQTET